MTPDVAFLLSGIAFGLSAGLSPGPLLTLVISETLKHGIQNGIRVAVAPLLTDLPIVSIAVFLVSHLSDIKPLLGAISLGGAAFLIYLGYESLVFKGVELDTASVRSKSFRKGIAANFLNPSPYLFWISIGGPMMVKGMAIGVMPAVWFIVGFYLLLVGTKVLLAVIVGKSKKFLKSAHYVYTVRLLGIVLVAFAAMFVRDGLKFLGVY